MSEVPMTAAGSGGRHGRPRGRRAELRGLGELIVHLAHRHISSTYRRTLLGWSWPLVKQVAQLAVLVFVFSVALDLGIDDYASFVFTGLIAWSWFSSGIQDASWSVISNRHLVFRAGFPTIVLPLISIATRFIDVLLAVPVLVVLLAIQGDLHATALLFPALVVLQFALMAGLGWIVASLSAYLRDIPNLTAVLLMLLFYLTPVFYDIDRVPADYRWLLELNPIAALLGCYRDVLLAGSLPDGGSVLLLVGFALVIGVLGRLLFRRLAPDFVDVL